MENYEQKNKKQKQKVEQLLQGPKHCDDSCCSHHWRETYGGI